VLRDIPHKIYAADSFLSRKARILEVSCIIANDCADKLSFIENQNIGVLLTIIMKIICAGWSKTGTKSLAEALKILGFTVHDFDEHLVYFKDEYIQAFEGKMHDFGAMYKSVDAVIDYPVFFFWKEIKESCPSAKVILTERDNAETVYSTEVYGQKQCSSFGYD